MTFVVLLGLGVLALIVMAFWPKPQARRQARGTQARRMQALREIRREVEQIERGVGQLRADWSVVVAAHALESPVEPRKEVKPRPARRHWIQTFNEAECFRYTSVAGTSHYFRPLGKVYRNEVYFIKVQRIRTGEILDIMTKALDPCTLAEAGDDPATDDARTGNDQSVWR